MEGFRQAQQLTEGVRGQMFTVGFLGVLAITIGLGVGLFVIGAVLGHFAPTVAALIAPLATFVIRPIMLLSFAALYRALRNASMDQPLPA